MKEFLVPVNMVNSNKEEVKGTLIEVIFVTKVNSVFSSFAIFDFNGSLSYSRFDQIHNGQHVLCFC